MSNRTTTLARVRTAAAIKADAPLLYGVRSQVAAAAADTGDATPAPDETGTVGELWLYGVVGGWWRGFDAESVANALRGLDVDVLYVRIHSPGGRASDGIAIGNLLRNHAAKVVVVVDGIAASAASVIAIAGDEIVMCPGSQMMIHDALLGTYGNEAQLRRDADWIGKQSDNYAGVYAHKAGGDPAKWRELMRSNDGEGTWYTADEAVAAGLADSVGTRTATSSPPVAPEDEIDENDDELLARIEHDLRVLEHDVHPAARAAWNGERPTKPPTASAGGSTNTQGGSAVPVTIDDAQLTTLRDKLELPADADVAAVVAAVTAVVDESLEEHPPTTPAQAAVQVPEGFSLVDNETLAALRTGAQDGAAARAQQLTEHRDRTIAQAIADGKFPPARQEHYEAAWKADPEGTEQLIAGLASGLVPVEERGHAQPAAEATQAAANPAALAGFAAQLGLTEEDLRG